MSGKTRSGSDTESGGNDGNVSPKQEPAVTPLISVADVPDSVFPVHTIPEERRYIIEEHAEQIANSWSGTIENHITAKIGEDTVAYALGQSEQLDLTVYPDSGDGGWDLQYKGATIDVKTLSRRNAHCRTLRISAHKPLRADYYALASRIGPGDCRLIGYVSRKRVANTPPLRGPHGQQYHVIDAEYLWPFLSLSPYL